MLHLPSHPRNRKTRILSSIVLGFVGLSISVGVAVGINTASTQPAFAATCGGVETSIISGTICDGADKESKDSSKNPIVSVLTFVLQILTGAVGLAAVGAIIYGAILYSSAGGNSGQVEKAKTTIMNTVIGIVCYAGMILILNFIIPGGVFGQEGVNGSGTSASPGGGSSSDSSGGGTANGATTLTVATWNTLFSNKTPIANGAKSVAKSAQIVALQEVHWVDSIHRNSIIKNFICSTCAYDGYMDPATRTKGGSEPASLPIAWDRARFTRIDAGYKLVYLETDWKNGAGGASDRWITWVKLQDKNTKQQFYVLNTHTVAEIESKGLPKPAKQKAYRQHMDVLISTVSSFQKEKLPIILLGDLNVNYRYDSKVRNTEFPYYRLGKIGLKSNWDLLNLSGISSSASTHGSNGRLIDYAWLWGSDVTARTTSIGSKYGSDHHAVYTTLTMGSSKTTDSTSSSSGSSQKFDKIQNFRDAAASSTVLKTGILYRSMRLSEASSSDITKLTALLSGGTVIDLRETKEREADPDPYEKMKGITNLSIPATGTTNYAKYFVMNKADRNAFKKALETIAKAPGKVLVHCTYGKDRTGWTIAMIMYAAGANDAQVMKEFLISNEDLPAGKVVKESWLKDGLAKARKEYGSISGYLKKGLGLSDETITKLNSKLKR